MLPVGDDGSPSAASAERMNGSRCWTYRGLCQCRFGVQRWHHSLQVAKVSRLETIIKKRGGVDRDRRGVSLAAFAVVLRQ